MARTISPNTTSTELLDTNIFNEITGEGLEPVNPSIGTTSTKTAGVVKLVNRFLKLMYTLKGTNYLNKSEGTFFINIFNYSTQDSTLIQSRVQDAIDDAADQIISTQSRQGVPNAERLRRAFISAFEVVDNNEVQIQVSLELVTGTLTPVELPSITIGPA